MAQIDARGLSPREARRQLRIEHSREQILDTAEQLFSEYGYQETGLKDVAERCEFSVGSIYTFFASKDALYAAVLMRRGGGQLTAMRRIAEGDPPALDRLLAMARLQIEYFRTHPAWGKLTTRALTIGVTQATALPDEFQDAYHAAIDMEAQLIVDGQRDGSLRTGDPRALARLFSAMVTAFHAMDPDIGDQAEHLDLDDFLGIVGATFAPSVTASSPQI